MDTSTSEPIPLAKITAPYGIRGWVKVHWWSKDSALLKNQTEVYGQSSDGNWNHLYIEEIKQHGRGWVARIRGCDDRNAAEAYLGMTLAVPKEQLAPLKPNEYYWHQLCGIQVWSGTSKEDAVLLGRVDHFMETGANDVMVVMPCADSHSKTRLLVPWVVPEIICEVNLEEQWLRIPAHWVS